MLKHQHPTLQPQAWVCLLTGSAAREGSCVQASGRRRSRQARYSSFRLLSHSPTWISKPSDVFSGPFGICTPAGWAARDSGLGGNSAGLTGTLRWLLGGRRRQPAGSPASCNPAPRAHAGRGLPSRQPLGAHLHCSQGRSACCRCRGSAVQTPRWTCRGKQTTKKLVGTEKRMSYGREGLAARCSKRL